MEEEEPEEEEEEEWKGKKKFYTQCVSVCKELDLSIEIFFLERHLRSHSA